MATRGCVWDGEKKWSQKTRKNGNINASEQKNKHISLSLAAQTLNFYTNSPMSSLFERHYQNTMGSAILWNLLASCSITGTLLINWIIHPMGAMSSTKTNEGEKKKEGKRRRNFPSDSIPFCVLSFSLARSFCCSRSLFGQGCSQNRTFELVRPPIEILVKISRTQVFLRILSFIHSLHLRTNESE